jgi:hypothetical protein
VVRRVDAGERRLVARRREMSWPSLSIEAMTSVPAIRVLGMSFPGPKAGTGVDIPR